MIQCDLPGVNLLCASAKLLRRFAQRWLRESLLILAHFILWIEYTLTVRNWNVLIKNERSMYIFLVLWRMDVRSYGRGTLYLVNFFLPEVS